MKLSQLSNVIRTILKHPLNRKRKLGAIFDFVVWQLRSRLFKKEHIYRWINRAKVAITNKDQAFTQNIYCGLYDFQEMAFILHSITADDVFADIGANLGSYTLLACASQGAVGHAFEPSAISMQKLRKNIRLNNIENQVTTYETILSDRIESLPFTSGLDCENHVLEASETSGKTNMIQATTLDKVLLNEHTTCLKIDVEGYEYPVLKGARSLLAQPQLNAIIIELNANASEYGNKASDPVNLLKDYGFNAYDYDPFTRTLKPTSIALGQTRNYIFIKNLVTTKDKLQNTKPFTIKGQQV